uniref:Carbohydrate sulfotransferase n=1 Tax=Clastoptera arizonana TaxID=38151 RepID=A0A1B6D0G0_9HEMI
MRLSRLIWPILVVPLVIALLFYLIHIITVHIHIMKYKKDDTNIVVTISDEQITKVVREAATSIEKRLLRIQEVCKKYNLGLYKNTALDSVFNHPPTPQYSVFYIDLVHKLSWCPIYKAASSTWLYSFCLLGGYKEEELDNRKQQLSTLARKVYPELDYPLAEQALQSTLKLMVVRHPFERILSAYRDKLENIRIGGEHGTAHFYRSYGARIVSKYRLGGNLTRTQDLLTPGTFYWEKDDPEPAGIEPTFKEFVRYLIDLDLTHYADDHWIPFYLYCTPCLLNYNIIAKVETLQRDQIYAIKMANLYDLIKPRWQHKTIPNGKSADEISKIYFSQLTMKEIERLHEKYRLDFELFNYSINKHLKYANDYNKNKIK